jgi:hypothetical protein
MMWSTASAGLSIRIGSSRVSEGSIPPVGLERHHGSREVSPSKHGSDHREFLGCGGRKELLGQTAQTDDLLAHSATLVRLALSLSADNTSM